MASVETLVIREGWVKGDTGGENFAETFVKDLGLGGLELDANLRQTLDLSGKFQTLAKAGKQILETREKDSVAWNGEQLKEGDVIQDTDDAMMIQAMVNATIEKMIQEGELASGTPDVGAIDGFITSDSSVAAVELLQEKFGLSVDGVPGKEFLTALVGKLEGWSEVEVAGTSAKAKVVIRQTEAASPAADIQTQVESAFSGDQFDFTLGGNQAAVTFVNHAMRANGVLVHDGQELGEQATVDERAVAIAQANLGLPVSGKLDKNFLTGLVLLTPEEQISSIPGRFQTTFNSLRESLAGQNYSTNENSAGLIIFDAFHSVMGKGTPVEMQVMESGFYAVAKKLADKNIALNDSLTAEQESAVYVLARNVYLGLKNEKSNELSTNPAAMDQLLLARVTEYLNTNRGALTPS